MNVQPTDPTAAPGPESLRATPFIDSDHPAVRAFAAEQLRPTGVPSDPTRQAVTLYLAVRDHLRYDPYQIDLSPAGMQASSALQAGRGWCVPKAVLLAALARASAIPARLGFADVRNHLSTERLRQTMQTDVFVWHGYTELWLNGRWRKATPAFNIGLCDKFGLLPLDFDGVNDSLYHPYDRAGQQHMEYVRERGSFNDLPLAALVQTFAKVYQAALSQGAAQGRTAGADFERDAGLENRP